MPSIVTIFVSIGLLIGFLIYLAIFLFQGFKNNKSGDFLTWGLVLCVIGSAFYVLDTFVDIRTRPDARQTVFMIIATLIFTVGFMCFHVFFERNKADFRVIWNMTLLL